VASRPRVGVVVRWRESRLNPTLPVGRRGRWRTGRLGEGCRGWPRVSGGGGGGDGGSGGGGGSGRSGGGGSGGGTKRWRFSLSSPGTARRGFK